MKRGEVRTVTQATIKLIRIGAAPLLPPDRLPGSPSGQACAVNEGILRRIDAQVGKRILADHYDVYLQKEDNPCSRTVEGHYELDAFEYWGARLPYRPQGAVDGKVMDSDMAKDLSFWARWGSSSGIPFDAEAFLAEHIQWSHLKGYLKDRPSEPWTLFRADEAK